MARYTAGRLAEISATVMVSEFRRYLAMNDPLSAFDPEGCESSNDNYLAYLSELLGGGLRGLLTRYPVMARQLAEEFDRRLNFARELARHLDNDISELRDSFGLAASVVEDFSSGLGDLHHTGRMVVKFTFGGGQSLIYKPRSLAKESAFIDFAAVFAPELQPARVLDRGSYGWMECISHRSCSDVDSVHRCYYRLGLLLALVHGLRGNDCHFENLIVDGDRPVLIDGETLGHGRASRRADDHPRRRIADELESSILATGFLPIWVALNEHGEAYDAGAFGATGGSPMPLTTLHWRAMNTDGMRPERRPRETPFASNTVVLENRIQSPIQHISSLCEGFQDGYRRLMDGWRRHWSPGSALERLVTSPTRFILRSTRIYHQLLARARDPRFLRDGAEHDLFLEQLATTYIKGWTTVESKVWFDELRALHDLDVPYFEVRGEETGPGSQSGRQVVEEQLRSLSPEGLERQLEILQLVYRQMDALPAQPPTRVIPKVTDQENLFQRAAQSIAATMLHNAVRHENGHGAWWSVAHAPLKGRLQPVPTGHDLYSGTAGIALFLANFEASRDLARETSVDACRLALSSDLSGGRGLFDGAAGFLYLLSHLDSEDEELQAWRSQLRETVEQSEPIAWDIGGGAAGRLMAVAGFGSSDFLAAEVRRLVKAQNSQGGWDEARHQALGGYAHGSAGIAAALLRAAVCLDDADAYRAARLGFDFQKSLDLGAGRWSDLRPGGESSLSWCNGSAGVGLAALEAHLVGCPEWSEDLLEPALQAVLSESASSDTCACCGAMGGIDLLLEAGRILGRPALIKAARRRARPWAAAVLSGQYPLARGCGTLYCQGLFQGLAGLGWGFLRLADPERYRSVLAWR
jgi:type 2 lantibiotic biosynthesis protein LanM